MFERSALLVRVFQLFCCVKKELKKRAKKEEVYSDLVCPNSKVFIIHIYELN